MRISSSSPYYYNRSTQVLSSRMLAVVIGASIMILLSTKTLITTAQATPWEYTKLRRGRFPLATCLDGSMAAYYLRKGAESNKVFVHYQGGGWCSEINTGTRFDCATRAKTRLGTTRHDGSKNFQKSEGYYSEDERKNHAFHNWTQVYVRYCDGASFSGGKREAIPNTSPPIYSRGKFILKAMIRQLFGRKRAPYRSATHIAITGGSAGSLAVYLHAHTWRKMLPNRVKVVAIPDSGYFPEWYAGPGPNEKVYGETMKGVYDIARPKEGLPKQCIKSQGRPSRYYRCMFAANVLEYIPIPVFIINSRFDTFTVGKIFGYEPGAPATTSGDNTISDNNENIATGSDSTGNDNIGSEKRDGEEVSTNSTNVNNENIAIGSGSTGNDNIGSEKRDGEEVSTNSTNVNNENIAIGSGSTGNDNIGSEKRDREEASTNSTNVNRLTEEIVLREFRVAEGTRITVSDVNQLGKSITNEILNKLFLQNIRLESKNNKGGISMGSGLFLPSCSVHCISQRKYTTLHVNKVNANEAVSQWIEQVFDPKRRDGPLMTWISDNSFQCTDCCS